MYQDGVPWPELGATLLINANSSSKMGQTGAGGTAVLPGIDCGNRPPLFSQSRP